MPYSYLQRYSVLCLCSTLYFFFAVKLVLCYNKGKKLERWENMPYKRNITPCKRRKKAGATFISLLCTFSMLCSCLMQSMTGAAQTAETMGFTEDGVTYQVADDGKLYVTGFDQDAMAQTDSKQVLCYSQYWSNLQQKYYPVGGINEGVFEGARAAKICCEIQGDYVIGAGAFKNLEVPQIINSTVTDNSVYFIGAEGYPAKLAEIGEEAFAGMKVNNDFKVGVSVGSIGAYAFKDAIVYGKISFEKEIDSIGAHAFDHFWARGISFPDAVRSIGDGAFANMNLTAFTLPQELECLGSKVFENCNMLTTIILPGGNAMKEVAVDAFPDQEKITIVIPSTVNNLTMYHFENYQYTVFQLPEDTAQDSALLAYLKSIGVKYQIGPEGEVQQGGATGETLPPQETGSPEPTELVSTPSVEPIVPPSGEPTVSPSVGPTGSPSAEPTEPVSTPSEEPTAPPSEETESPEPTQSATPVESLKPTASPAASPGNGNSVVPTATTAPPAGNRLGGPAVGDSFVMKKARYRVVGTSTVVFAGVIPKKITKITIPPTVTYQGNLFQVTGITDKACWKQKKLKSVVVGNSVTKVGNQAFAGCTSLTGIVFGEQVTTLGKKVLYGDKKLKKITFRGKKLKKIGSKSFSGVPRKAKIVVPKSKMKAYQNMINKS